MADVFGWDQGKAIVLKASFCQGRNDLNFSFTFISLLKIEAENF